MAHEQQPVWKSPGVKNGIKLAVLAALILVLLIPLGLIRGIVSEREALHAEAVRAVTDQAGGEQLIAGPVVLVPVDVPITSAAAEPAVSRHQLFMLSEEVDIRVELAPETLQRGIYEVPVYTADVTISALLPPRTAAPPHSESGGELRWDQAELIIPVARLDGLRTEPTVALPDSHPRPVTGSSVRLSGLPAVSLPFTPDPERATTVTVRLTTNGGASFSLVPTAERATTTVTSPWPDPGFRGRQVPSQRSVGADGFSATWESTALGLGLPPATVTRAGSDPGFPLQSLAFGVELYQPVDRYQRSLRAVKYGPLFLLLPFVAIFLMELWSGKRVHPVQYLLIAAAKLVFYLVLLSLSEHVSFALAYWSATAATIGVVSVYLLGALPTRAQAALMSAIVAAEYLFLYTALVSRDHALLIGSIGLFVVVAITMIATRRVDWYAPQVNRRIDPLTK